MYTFVYTCCLGYINPEKALRVHVDDEDKGVNEMGTPGGTQKVTFVNESGLYSLILASKLPQAKAFKRWVTAEVLPQIRTVQNDGIRHTCCLQDIADISHEMEMPYFKAVYHAMVSTS